MSQPENQQFLIFRARLQALLAERGISQRQLALAIGIRPQSVNNYLRGITKLPGAQELFALAQYFGVAMEHFLTADQPQQEKLTTEDQLKQTAPVIPATAVRRAAEQMRRCADALNAEAQNLEHSGGGEAAGAEESKIDMERLDQQPANPRRSRARRDKSSQGPSTKST